MYKVISFFSSVSTYISGPTTVSSLTPPFFCSHHPPGLESNLFFKSSPKETSLSLGNWWVIDFLGKVSSADVYEGSFGEINCVEDEWRLEEEMLSLAKDTGTLEDVPPLCEWWTFSFWVTATCQIIILNSSIWLSRSRQELTADILIIVKFNFDMGCLLAYRCQETILLTCVPEIPKISKINHVLSMFETCQPRTPCLQEFPLGPQTW